MANKLEPRLPRGMRDILPEKMVLRRHVIDIIENGFERYGFEPLQTPALELSDTLMGKYGPDAEKLIYDARHREGKEALSLRYDLTVPLTRVLATYPTLNKPFKRYQIAPVWRAERPQKGRYREFYQCDADIVGTPSMLADAEIIAMIQSILDQLGFREFEIKINHRKILAGIGKYAGVAPALLPGLYRALDKFEKIGRDGVREELEKNEIPDEVARRLLDLVAIPVSNLHELREWLDQIPEGRRGLDETEELLGLIRELGVPDANIQMDFTMVRGLDYYTGPIYETVVTEPKIGSLTGGGRFDELIGLFSKQSFPATGTTIGIERIIDVMEELGMFPRHVGKTVAQVLVTVFDEARRKESIRITAELRAAGLNTDLWLDLDNLGKQLKYAAAKGIPFAVIAGPDEAASGSATLRDLETGEQLQLPHSKLAEVLRRKLEDK